MLTVDRIVAGYGRARVLHGIMLDIPDGAVVAILGPNGAGKSTLLKAISGIVRPSAGTISFDAHDITHADPARIVRRGVVHVPEGRHIFSDLTVEENLRLGAFSQPGPAPRDHVFELFPILRERRSQRGGSLSGGEQQMLAIGRALMARPRLLLLDEPSLGLAPIVVERIYDAISRLRETGVAIGLVEQNADRARAFADRAIVISHGRIRYDGPSDAAEESLHRAYLGVA
ncbi:MAG: ABC transporter ATP-binding protein [Candidatus Velthaea sp.]